MQDKRFKILIVDDEPQNIQITASILQNNGYQMAFSQDGKSALKNIRENAFDLILLDVLMPEMDGLEVCKALKESTATFDIPVIFLTAKDGIEDIIKGFEAGAADYVTKPFNSVELIARVSTHAKLKEKRDNEKYLISRLESTVAECKRTEEALKQASDNLERMVAERTAELKKSNEQLKIEIEERKQAEEALRESEAKYRSLASTEDSMYLVDRHCRYLFMNERHVSRFGTSLNRIINKCYGEFHSEESTQDFIGKVETVFETGSSNQHEYKSERDGRYFLRTFSPVKNQEGKGTIAVTVVSKDITDRKQAEEELMNRERELKVNSRNLEELNAALRVLLRQRQRDKDELEENVLSNVKQLIIPYIIKLKKCRIDAKEADYISILESNLKDIVSPFSSKLSTKYLNLTPREIQIANLIREGKTTKEIAEILNSSTGTVEFHRSNMREKLNIKSKKSNLRSFLLTLK